MIVLLKPVSRIGLAKRVFLSLSIVLVCAVVASLALGVLVAYGICVAMFGLFWIHARQVAANRARPVAAKLTVVGN